jgi:hypothetical protein
MSLADVLASITPRLSGRIISDSEACTLARNFPTLQLAWLVDIMLDFPVVGCEFDLDDPLVSMKWITPQEMVDEVTEFYPGIAAIKAGFFPIGQCLMGSGDPYFIQTSTVNSRLFRIPHDAVDDNDCIVQHDIDVISQTLSQFFEQAQIS